MILFSEIILSALIFNLYYFEKCDFEIGVLKVFLMILGIPKSQFTVSKQHFGPHKMISAVSKIMSTNGPFMWAGTSNFANLQRISCEIAQKILSASKKSEPDSLLNFLLDVNR